MSPRKTAKEGINYNLNIGDVYLMRFDGTGNEQGGVRPGVVFQNNVGNKFSPNIIALPVTSVIKKNSQPTHVVIRAEDIDGLKRDSMVLCENPQRLSRSKVYKHVGSLDEEAMKGIAIGNALASSAIGFLSYDELIDVWQRAKKLNGFQ